MITLKKDVHCWYLNHARASDVIGEQADRGEHGNRLAADASLLCRECDGAAVLSTLSYMDATFQ